MSEKIARLGIDRDPNKMYYIKDGDVWATPRKQPGKPKGKAVKVASPGLDLDYSKYLYFVDGDGDVARKEKKAGGRRKTKVPAAKAPKAGKPAAARNGNGKKSEAQIAAEVDECLAKIGAAGYTVSKAKSKSKR